MCLLWRTCNSGRQTGAWPGSDSSENIFLCCDSVNEWLGEKQVVCIIQSLMLFIYSHTWHLDVPIVRHMHTKKMENQNKFSQNRVKKLPFFFSKQKNSQNIKFCEIKIQINKNPQNKITRDTNRSELFGQIASISVIFKQLDTSLIMWSRHFTFGIFWRWNFVLFWSY